MNSKRSNYPVGPITIPNKGEEKDRQGIQKILQKINLTVGRINQIMSIKSKSIKLNGVTGYKWSQRKRKYKESSGPSPVFELMALFFFYCSTNPFPDDQVENFGPFDHKPC